MTFLGKVMALFPAFHVFMVVSCTVGFVVEPSAVSFCVIPLMLYIFPLLIFQLHNRMYPLEEGTFSIVQGYSPWFGTHMIQQNFISFKWTEEILRTIPGLFSLWLRAWGAKVGKNVYFAPHFEIADRSLVDVADNVIFGYGVRASSHIISANKELGGMAVYIRCITVEKGALVGALCQVGPGSLVKRNAVVRVGTVLITDEVVEAKK